MKQLSILVFTAFFSFQCKEKGSSELLVEGIQNNVEIITDRWGVPHIYADNEHDLFFAQGFQAARDRLFQLEMFRRCAEGSMSEIFGANELERDLGARLFRYRGDLADELMHYHPRGRAIIEAFIGGINAYVKQVNEGRQPLPVEFEVLGFKPGYWTPSTVVSRHAGWITNVQEEISVAKMIMQIGEEKTRAITNYHPHNPDLRIDPQIDINGLTYDVLGPYLAWRQPWRVKANEPNAFGGPNKTAADGSNNWVVHGNKTNSGFPIMANDPHRVIGIPSIRYLVHLNAPGWNVIGAGEPMIPGVSIGHNEQGAWGLTIFDTDTEDLYVYKLNPADLSQYWYKGQWLRFEKIADSIRIKDQPNKIVELLYSVHGPVTYVDSSRSTAYAIRAGWLGKGAAPYLASLRMNQAQSWEEFRQACSFSYLPGENMVWADKAGNIGCQAVGIAAIRNRYSGMVPVPGDGRYEWDSILPVLELPWSLNPADGFVNTANENRATAGYPHLNALSYSWADSFRAIRAREFLLQNKKFSIADMQQLQMDFLSVPAREILPLLKELEPIDPRVKKAKQLLMNWDHEMTDSSVVASIYFIFELLVERYVLEKMGLVNNNLPPLGMSLTKMVRTVREPGKFMSAAERDDILLSALIGSVAVLSERLGPDMNAWRYGQEKMKHVKMLHPLSSPSRTAFDIGPTPRGGDGNTINSTGGLLNQSFGASVRLIFDCSDWDLGVATNSPGQSGDPASNHYRDLFEGWSRNEYFPLYFSREKILRVAESKLLMVPESRKQ